MPRILGAFVALAALSLLIPNAVLGDTPTRGRILAPGDHFLPGDPMPITGSEIEEGAELVIRLTNGATTVELGRATVRADGTFDTSVVVPATFPLGYAELTATAPTDSVWEAIVLIGERAEGPRDPSSGAIDERSIWLLVLGAGLVVFVVSGFVWLRGRPRTSSDGDRATS